MNFSFSQPKLLYHISETPTIHSATRLLKKLHITINQPQSTTQIIVQKKLSVDFTTINVM